MAPTKLLDEALTRSVIGAFYEVYNTLGFGLFEDLYGLARARIAAERPSQSRESCSYGSSTTRRSLDCSGSTWSWTTD